MLNVTKKGRGKLLSANIVRHSNGSKTEEIDKSDGNVKHNYAALKSFKKMVRTANILVFFHSNDYFDHMLGWRTTGTWSAAMLL